LNHICCRDVISVFSSGGGGNNLTDSLGEAKYEEKKCVQKHKKLLYFKIRGVGQMPAPALPNDVPDLFIFNLSFLNITNFVNFQQFYFDGYVFQKQKRRKRFTELPEGIYNF